MTINFENSPIYVNSGIREFVTKVSDLFCLESVDFDFNISNRRINGSGISSYPGWGDINRHLRIIVGCKEGKVRGTTIVHELFHMGDRPHMREINGTHDYIGISYCATEKNGYRNNQVDNYSRLIVKDLTGKYEVFL
jgi:hypothetical protein